MAQRLGGMSKLNFSCEWIARPFGAKPYVCRFLQAELRAKALKETEAWQAKLDAAFAKHGPVDHGNARITRHAPFRQSAQPLVDASLCHM